MSTLALVQIIARHVPAGVINCVTGEQGFGSAITAHTGIQKIVFTGSTATGQSVMRGAASNLKRLTLELGGNDAAIVLPGTSVETVAGRFSGGLSQHGPDLRRPQAPVHP